MKRSNTNLLAYLLCGILLIQPLVQQTIDASENTDLLDGGTVHISDDVTILQVSGDHYQMGYQHGYLLKENVQQNIRAYLSNIPTNESYLLQIWNTMEPYIPTCYIEEFQGIADGAEISYTDLVTAYTVIIYGDMGCFGISCWGNTTETGELLHLRSFDLPMDVQDPISGRYVHENHVLIIRKPNGKIASISPSVAGSMHGGGGFNKQGISLGMQVCWSKDQTFHGIPGMIRTQMVLDTAATSEEAIDILTTHRTLGWNYVLSDANEKQGYIIETTANHTYVGTDHHPTENIHPFYSIDDMVRRTNFFIDPTIVSTQRDTYNPSSLSMFIKLIQRKDYFFAIWQSYHATSKAFQQESGTYTPTSLMNLFREAYKGDTNFLLRFIISKAEDTSFNHAWNIWVVEPSSGEFYVSFADHDTIAYDTPVHHFNMNEYI